MIGVLHALVVMAVAGAAAVVAGQVAAVAMHRYTQLSLANLYPPLGLCGLAAAGSLAFGSRAAATVCVILGR